MAGLALALPGFLPDKSNKDHPLDIRRLFSGAAYLTLASVFGRAISLVSFPILTHLLTPSAYGVAALAFSMISLLTVFSVAGQDTSLIRHYHSHETYDPATIVRFFSRFGIGAGALFGCLGALAWIAYNGWSIEGPTATTGGILALSIWGATVATFSKSIARLEGRYGRLAFALVLAGLGGFALSVGTAVAWQANEVALLMAGLAPWIVVTILPKSKSSVAGKISDRKHIQNLMRIGYPMIFTAVGFWVIASVDRWFLSSYAGLEKVGIYSVAVTIATLGQIVTTALVAVWNPEVFRNVKGSETANSERLGTVLTMLLWILISTWFGISMFGGILIKLLAAPEFHVAATYVPWIALGYMIYGFNQMLGFGFMIHHRTSAFVWFWAAGVAISLGLNFALVPPYGITGAIASQICAFSMISGLTWWIGRRWTPFQPRWMALFLAFMFYSIVAASMRGFPFESGIVPEICIRALLTIAALTTTGWLASRILGMRKLSSFPFLRKKRG